MKLLLTFYIIIFLSSCSFFQKPSPVIAVNKPKLELKNPDKMELSNVQIKVLNSKNKDLYFSENDVAFALTEQQYKNLSINFEMMKSYIKKQITIINIYKDYYEGDN